MKAFRFTLEAVSTLRQRQEQKALDLYAQTLLARRQAADALKAVEGELSASWQDWRGRLTGGCTAAEAVQVLAYQRSLSRRLEECTLALETAERRLGATLQGLFLARRQREIVDKCFDKQKTRYQREQARGEQKFMDDLAGRRGHSILAWKPAETSL